MRQKDKRKKIFAGLLRSVIIAALWFGLWQLASMTTIELLIPSPLTVIKTFIGLCRTDGFSESVLLSLLRIIAGWLLGLLGGVFIAVLTSLSKSVRAFFAPALHIIKATPVASFILLALVWLSSSKVPTFTAFLIVLPSVWANVSEGIGSADRQLIETARVFRMSVPKRLSNLYIPSVLPYFSAAAKTGLGLAWKAGISAEVICTPVSSIGRGIYRAKLYLETPELFAWTLTVIVLSLILEKLFGFFLERAVRND